MGKTCWICRNTEDYFLNQKEELLKSTQNEINECERFEENILEETKDRLGFTDEKKERVRNISDVYTKMTLTAILENKQSFLQLEPSLEIIFHYIDAFNLMRDESRRKGIYPRKNEVESATFKILKDAIELYLQEPLESRYSNDLMRNESRKKALYLRKSELERISTFFIEKEMTAQSLDSMFSKSSSFSFSRLGFNIHKRIYLCPFCLALFAEAASASFDVRDAQIKAMEAAALDDDWDDDDWD
ncbi:MAG: hypothetical protein J6C11_08120 [Spirochaetaceae bacterium]|nr:hypothetical protein [Spirochaetaceae bacterium]